MAIAPTVHIIMVEDDEGHALLIRRNLERAGLMNTITHFTTGSSAVEYFFGPQNGADLTDPTLILLDLNLPEMDGYEVLSRLKSDPRTVSLPVIILTTTDNPAEINRCYKLGCNVYITKPVDYENFADSIRKLGLMLAVVKVPNILS